MKIQSISAVYFSATGNTEKVVRTTAEYISHEIGAPVVCDDFTLPQERSARREYTDKELVVFGVPTYAGRIPNKILPFVKTLFKGNNTPAVIITTFGNRAYENSLSELKYELSENGFIPFAAGAIACQHSFVDIGLGRPDEEDDRLLRFLASQACRKLREAKEIPESVEVKGELKPEKYYTPTGVDGKPVNFLKAKPVTDKALCDHCGICAEVCPLGSIDSSDPSNVPGICIKCHACVKKCPRHAKYFNDEAMLSHIRMIEQSCQRRALTEIFY